MFPLNGVSISWALITMSLSLLAVLMMWLSNTFAVANKDKLKSGDDSQFLMVLQSLILLHHFTLTNNTFAV